MSLNLNNKPNTSQIEEYGSELGDYNANKVFELLAESESQKKEESKKTKEQKNKNV
jgi:hypothetical protein